uniref:Uncharacterized protein n=1 Tax=Setaria italica TaxID=4555 RepID=K3ZLI0_SETIT
MTLTKTIERAIHPRWLPWWSIKHHTAVSLPSTLALARAWFLLPCTTCQFHACDVWNESIPSSSSCRGACQLPCFAGNFHSALAPQA